jgi:hypothetical protein
VLSDQLSQRMEQVADGPTSSPNLEQVLADARRRQRGRRIAAVGGIGAFTAVVVGVLVALGQGGGLRQTSASASPRLPVTVGTHYYPNDNTTCEVLTFTETGTYIDGLCLDVFTRDALPNGFFQVDDYRLMQVTAGGAPTMIVSGDVDGSGIIVVTDTTGHKVRANVLPSLPGHPVSMFYADLGPRGQRPSSVSFTTSNGDTRIEPQAPPATSAPPSPN